MKHLILFVLLVIISLVLSACSIDALPAVAAPESQSKATPAKEPEVEPVEGPVEPVEGAVVEPMEKAAEEPMEEAAEEPVEEAVTEPVTEEAVNEPITEEAVTEPVEEEAEAVLQEAKSISEITKEDERFTNLVTGLEAAGLAETFAGEGEFTVFAPTNEAFNALAESTKQSLFADPTGALKNVLLYHTVDGVITSQELANLAAVSTLAGQNIGVTVVGEGQIILEGYAQVIVADIEASNGVIHVVNAVLIPSGRG